jgi:pimeloyl-ACP methyl ester carboxylesterase
MSPITTRRIQAGGLSFAIDEAGQGDDVALLLHGFPESRRSWRGQMEALAALGWRAAAPDLRGYGESSRPAERSAYRIEALIEDAGAIFDVLGARRRLLIGHDWGGVIAWVFAMERTRPLDGLVILNAPHPAVYIDLMRRSWRQRARSWYAAAFQLPWLPEALLTARGAQAVERAFSRAGAAAGAFAPDMLAHLRANAAEPGAMTAMLNYYRANVTGLGRWGPGRALRIETPTLLIWGERDPFLGVELTQVGEAYVRDLTVRRLPHASHWPAQDDPATVNGAIADWLAARVLVA